MSRVTSPSTPATKAERDLDRTLDLALEQSFPASDPPSPVRDADAQLAAEQADDALSAAEKARESRELDEALKETFPASDPPAIVQPHGSRPEDEEDA